MIFLHLYKKTLSLRKPAACITHLYRNTFSSRDFFSNTQFNYQKSIFLSPTIYLPVYIFKKQNLLQTSGSTNY